MRNIRSLVVITSVAGLAAVVVAPVASSQYIRGEYGEDISWMTQEAKLAAWRVPGGGTDCAESCTGGLRCCSGTSIE